MNKLQKPAGSIRTPDYRLRVFVSSTLKELAAERDAVRQAISNLRLTPIIFEAGARPHPANELYRAYLAQSDIFIGIYWQSYGWIAPDQQISGLEDEYNRSSGMPRLLYIKAPAPDREADLRAMLERIRDENTGSYKTFASAEELGQLVENDLALLLSERFEAPYAQQPQPAEAAQHLLTNVPIPRNPLVGRERELQAARDLLLRDDVGLVTLVGPGGCGKSRLGIEIALGFRDHFADGVFMVFLESLSEASMVVPAICRTLGVAESGAQKPLLDVLSDFLCQRSVLLVLDNFEHVLGAALEIGSLLERCPRTKILVTSRAPLRVRAEKELPVPPLELPPLEPRPRLEALSHYAAVELFVQRAQAVRPDFRITDENSAAVAQLCHRLDGLPLAIELAAARIRMLSPQMLLQRLMESSTILRGGTTDLPERQRTLERTIDWSYHLLSPADQVFLRRLSVFAGGLAADAAESVCNPAAGDQVESLEQLMRLADMSLLVAEERGGAMRYRMLETVREYALLRLHESGEADAIRRAHFEFYFALAQQIQEKGGPGDQRDPLQDLRDETDNFRAALDWSVNAGEFLMALRMALRIGIYWKHFLPLTEGRDRLVRILAGTTEPSTERARGLCQLGVVANAQGDYAFASTVLEQALTLAEKVDDPYATARSAFLLSWVQFSLGEAVRSRELMERSLALFHAQELPDEEAHVLVLMAERARAEGDLRRARQLDEQALALMRPGGDELNLHLALGNLGLLLIHFGELERSDDLLREGLLMALKTRSVDYHFILMGFGFLANARGQATRAARILGASSHLLRSEGRVIDTGDRTDYEQNLASLRAQLDEATFARAWEEGEQMTKDQAVRYALESGGA